MDLPALADIAARLAKLTAEVESLREQVLTQRRSEAETLRDLKLRALAEFAAGAGHEINNPLAVISGQAQHLLKTEESFERARALERIVTHSQRIHRLLSDLMLYAKPPEPKRAVISLNKLVQTAADALSALAVERRVMIEVAAAPCRVKLRADPALLQMCIASLVQNAIEAAPADGWVRIRLDVNRPGWADVVVEDNGPGLPTTQQEHLFDPFYSGRVAGRGAGLGLPRAWRVAQLHGGEIRCSSSAGQPTQFVLSLPVLHVEKVGVARSSFSKNGHGNGRLTRRKAPLVRKNGKRSVRR